MTEKKQQYRAEVDTGEGVWYTNALRFDTKAEADDFALDLARRWTLVQHWRVVSDDVPLKERVIFVHGEATSDGNPS